MSAADGPKVERELGPMLDVPMELLLGLALESFRPGSTSGKSMAKLFRVLANNLMHGCVSPGARRSQSSPGATKQQLARLATVFFDMADAIDGLG